jgi:hypothetical protein
MPKHVLILATKYDRATSRTFDWAKELQDKLIPYVDTCFFIDVTGLCRAGQTMDEIAKIATHLIFYGHGEPDWWTALPGNPDTQLVGITSARSLNRANVYAVCCSSLTGLGAMHSVLSGRSYIGYDQKFRFDLENEQEFKKIVNDSAFNFIITGNAAQTVLELRSAWAQLANDFAGTLKLRKNAVIAGSFAQSNGQRVGSAP